MKPVRALLLASAAALLAAAAVIAQETEAGPVLVELNLHYRQDRFIMAPDVPSSEGSGGTSSIILSVMRAVDPRTNEPYDASEPALGFDPKDLRHLFRLEKQEFLLGEPILVEHRIELNGPGKWNWPVGGNYRARGRDDNFTFVLQRADGRIVPDVYPPLRGLIFGGGLMSEHTVEKGKPLSYWLGLQRYAAVTEPGLYDLYCLTGYKQEVIGRLAAMRAALPEEVARDHFIDDHEVLIDRATGEQSKRYSLGIFPEYFDSDAKWPLSGLLPADVLAFAAGQSFDLPRDDKGFFGVVAHFRIRIREGTPAEQRAMVGRWTKTAKALDRRTFRDSYNLAMLEALWYAKQDHFLPLLEGWVTSVKDPFSPDAIPMHLDALARRSDRAAFALLLKSSPYAVANAFHSLHADRVADAVPICIGWLTHADERVRSLAESRLVTWTGQSFGHTWTGYHYQRPTLAEGQSMQPRWREWWEKNKAGFKPQEPCPFPCEKAEKKDEAR